MLRGELDPMKVAASERIVAAVVEEDVPGVPVAAYASVKVSGVQTESFHEGEGLVVVIGTPPVILFINLNVVFGDTLMP